MTPMCLWVLECFKKLLMCCGFTANGLKKIKMSISTSVGEKAFLKSAIRETGQTALR